MPWKVVERKIGRAGGVGVERSVCLSEGKEFLADGVYEGTLASFLRSFFP